MSILSKISPKFNIETSKFKSSDREITELIKYSQIEIPTEYIEIIKEKTEIEILVDTKKYIQIWGADGCIEMNEAYHIQKYLPNSLAIADDGCSNTILYAEGKSGFGVYIVPLNDLEADEMVYLADSLEAFFVKEDGVDKFNNVW